MESRFGWGRRANREEEKNEDGEEVYDDDSSSEDDEGGIQNSTPGGSRIPRDPTHMFKYSAEAAAET
jgi:hypothetical protein